MLQEFRVDNYKSLINVSFRPKERNLLIGLNNSGKTNLCQAISFLAATSQRPLFQCADDVAGGTIGVTNFFFAKSTVDFRITAAVPFESAELHFDYELSIAANGKRAPALALEVEKETLRVSGDRFDNVMLMEKTPEGGLLLDEAAYLLKGGANYLATPAPRNATMLCVLYALPETPRASCFREYLSSWRYYSLESAALRGAAHSPNRHWLDQDGGNLASAIYHLKTMNERQYRKLLSHLRLIEPHTEVINFAVPSEEAVYMSLEDSEGHPLPASKASAGTLRFLALAYLLTAQPSPGPCPLLIIEEPENGIYVGYLKQLMALAESGESAPQLVFTSHSPYFIDLFDDRIDSIFVLKRGEQHSSITQPDVAKVKARLDKYPLGEQHFREMLG